MKNSAAPDLKLEELEFDIKLDGHGWALFTIKIGDQSVSIDGSYVRNCFDELLGAAINVEIGSNQIQTVSFELEPGEQRISLVPHYDTPTRTKFLHISVNEFRSSPPSSTVNAPGIQQLSAFIARSAFPKAVFDSMSKFASEPEDFEASWGNPFPIKGFNALEIALATPLRPEVPAGNIVASIRVTASESSDE